MPDQKSYKGVVESDTDGLFIRLPSSWSIDPIGADVCLEEIRHGEAYRVRPLLDGNGLPTSIFKFGDDPIS
jgi:hypothetical protein